jgi:hypothetical protein
MVTSRPVERWKNVKIVYFKDVRRDNEFRFKVTIDGHTFLSDETYLNEPTVLMELGNLIGPAMSTKVDSKFNLFTVDFQKGECRIEFNGVNQDEFADELVKVLYEFEARRRRAKERRNQVHSFTVKSGSVRVAEEVSKDDGQ